MNTLLKKEILPDGGLLIACSSHEPRCRGALELGAWKPEKAVVFHYDDPNPKRDVNHAEMLDMLDTAGVEHHTVEFTEVDAVQGLRENMAMLREMASSFLHQQIVFDMSVFTKRHLLMMLQWLDDKDLWDVLTVVYSEPGDYDVDDFLPLSFGLTSFQQVPGFSACPNVSRPLHLVIFLGYEGDRALAVFEKVQPMLVTLVIPDPPYRPEWVGRTERYNADLIALLGEEHCLRVDSVNPGATAAMLTKLLDSPSASQAMAKVIAPLGTKPQALGVYEYQRLCADPPALVYASPLRHSHAFYSHGIGPTRILKKAGV